MHFQPLSHDTPQSCIARTAPPRPVHFFAPDVLTARLAAFRAGFPGDVTYAVKANPSDFVLAQLWSEGIDGFDVASPEEIDQIRAISADARLNYHNPIRSKAEIAAGIAARVASWSVDCEGELDKLIAADVPRGAEVAVRFKLPVAGAHYDFGAKFGAAPEAAAALLRRVAEAGFAPALTFHVGTQCQSPDAWTSYMTEAAAIARAAGVRLARLNVGGGFPSARLADAVDLTAIFDAIRAALSAFDTAPRLTCEPGRGLVADAFAYGVEVKARRGDDIFLTDGIYGGLSEFVSMSLPRCRVVAPNGALKSTADRLFTLWGPTCDSLDKVPGPVLLPSDLAEGDWLVFASMGAYLTGVTTRFNGYGGYDTQAVKMLLP
jgi:ornithine decarboxylase